MPENGVGYTGNPYNDLAALGYNVSYNSSPEDEALAHARGGALEYSPLGKIGGQDTRYKNEQELLNSIYQNSFNSAEAQKNRDWQEYMSNTANQRAAKDLEALGFSPFALLGGASSASTPSGYAASGSQQARAQGNSGNDLIGGLIKTVATIALMSATKSNSTNVYAGNSAEAVAKEAIKKNSSVKWSKADQDEWNSLLAELGYGPNKK